MSGPPSRADSIADGFSGKDFRNALGCFGTGVTVVTTMGEGRAYGMTANAFSSVSLDPPLVLVCAISGTAGSEEIERNRCFAVNILAADQEPLSRYFSARDRPKGRDAFRDVDHKLGVTGAPLLDGVVGYLDCRLDHFHEAGDHVIFIGRVLDLHVAAAVEPLLFYAGGYRFLREEPG